MGKHHTNMKQQEAAKTAISDTSGVSSGLEITPPNVLMFRLSQWSDTTEVLTLTNPGINNKDPIAFKVCLLFQLAITIVEPTVIFAGKVKICLINHFCYST